MTAARRDPRTRSRAPPAPSACVSVRRRARASRRRRSARARAARSAPRPTDPSEAPKPARVEHPAQEALGLGPLGRGEDPRRVAALDDQPVVQEADLVGDLARERHLVRRDDHRHPLGLELAHDLEHLADQLGVERARDLVEQQRARARRQRAGDRDPLLLAAREAVGVVVLAPGQPEAREQLARPRLGLRTRHPVRAHGRERDVGERVEVREEVELPGRPCRAGGARATGATDGSVITAPSSSTSPSSISSSRSMQRSSVDLPEPGRPDQRDRGVLGRPRGRSRAARDARRRPS